MTWLSIYWFCSVVSYIAGLYFSIPPETQLRLVQFPFQLCKVQHIGTHPSKKWTKWGAAEAWVHSRYNQALIHDDLLPFRKTASPCYYVFTYFTYFSYPFWTHLCYFPMVIPLFLYYGLPFHLTCHMIFSLRQATCALKSKIFISHYLSGSWQIICQ